MKKLKLENAESMGFWATVGTVLGAVSWLAVMAATYCRAGAKSGVGIENYVDGAVLQSEEFKKKIKHKAKKKALKRKQALTALQLAEKN